MVFGNRDTPGYSSYGKTRDLNNKKLVLSVLQKFNMLKL